MLNAKYQEFCDRAAEFIPAEQIITDYIRTLTYGTDASFYRLVPKVVVRVDSESQIKQVLALSRELELPICFRASGTSLSGQAITDSILVSLSSRWKDYEITNDGKLIKMQCGVLGSEANAALLPFNTMLAPMPASIDAASVGGMAINNAAGMNSLDTYTVMASARFIFPNGQNLDTADQKSRDVFAQRCPELIDGVSKLAKRLRANETLSKRVQKKYSIKNTTGYGLRALLDFDDPIDMISHLMIGSEGTLGFIAEVTHNTVPIMPHKASTFLIFEDMASAGQAITRFKNQSTPLTAAELIDYFSLMAVADNDGVPAYIKDLPANCVALLVQAESDTAEGLQGNIDTILSTISDIQLLIIPEFSSDPAVYSAYWQVRKGIFPAVGANRKKGTTTLIEDVAFPIDRLSEALVDLQNTMQTFGYDDGVIYGHALDGNLHFIFSQGFDTEQEVARYQQFMTAICDLVVGKYDGSLKAEHGTGRNMAPFVRQEWGDEAYQLMVDIKNLFDPKRLLNPDVMITDDPQLYIKNIKPMPITHDLVDQCIECGFCERVCPSKNLTFTPRQRIVGQRELQVLNVEAHPEFSKAYDYMGVDTCAGCGLCSTVCPIGINTGDLIRQIRQQKNQQHTSKAEFLAKHFAKVGQGVKAALTTAHISHKMLGSTRMQKVADTSRKVSKGMIGKWLPEMPTANPPVTKSKRILQQPQYDKKVVYFPSCASQIMGPASKAEEQEPLFDATIKLLNKAGFEVIIPNDLSQQCCGMPFESKGMFDQAEDKAMALLKVLKQASHNGEYPIYFDTSPCTMRMLDRIPESLTLYDPVSFIAKYVLSELSFNKTDEPIACHVTCSARRMGLEAQTKAILEACSNKVVFPEKITCCGWAGDKGFTIPELNASALETLKPQVEHCSAGYSTSRTCEIGLSHHSGIDYQSIVYLVNKCAG